VDWSRVDFFWGDERAVPPDHPESNFGVAYQMLIAALPKVRPQAIHRMPGEAPDLDAAALAYEAELRLAFGARGDDPPTFDLIWLGMGRDGHTASLFPGAIAVEERRRWAIPCTAPSEVAVAKRMTFTLPLINAARIALFVVAGADKAPAIRSVRSGSRELPASRVRARSTLWLLDVGAAGQAGRT
jgi:6-phosphogluconolactonase